MNAGKHTEWVEFYKAALLEEDQEKLLQRIYLAVDAIRYRMWELLREETQGIGRPAYMNEWKALHNALQTLSAMRNRGAA